MLQDWLQVAGIAIDLAGFTLLLREWWLAFFHETDTIAFEQQRAWEQSLRHQHRSHASDQLRSHLDASARIHDEMTTRAARERHLATLRSRKRAFVVATVLIVIGALLQLAGALPEPVFAALFQPR
jgi:hypothetical protein